MRVVVTGAAGFIGSHLVDTLLARGDEVVGIDCFTPYYDRELKEANLARAGLNPDFELVEADLRVDDLTAALDGADAVVHEAASPGLTLGWDAYEEYHSCNVTALKRVIDAAAAVGLSHLVHASTSSVYGADVDGDELTATIPVSPYGITKLTAEHVLRSHGESSALPTTTLRYFSIYGPRQRPDMAYRAFCERMLKGEPVVIYGDGNQTRSITYVDDAVAATVAALDRPGRGDVLNVCGGREISVRDALQILSETLGIEPQVIHRDARAGDQRRTRADTRRAWAALGWEPLVEPAEGLAKEAEWVRRRVEGV